MGNTRIPLVDDCEKNLFKMTRAEALALVAQAKELYNGGHDGNITDWGWSLLEELHKHKNYHVRVAAWKAQGAPMPKRETHEETLAATIELAKKLQPNQVARYFKQQDAELDDTLGTPESNPGDHERAKEFTNVMKQQFCVSLLARISGQGMVI